MNIDELFRKELQNSESEISQNLWQRTQTEMDASLSHSPKGKFPSENVFSKVTSLWHSASLLTKVVSVAIVSSFIVAGTYLALSDADNADSKLQNTVSVSDVAELKDAELPKEPLMADTVFSDRKNGIKENESNLDFDISDEGTHLPLLSDNYLKDGLEEIKNEEISSQIEIMQPQMKTENVPGEAHTPSEERMADDIQIPNYISPNEDGINDCFLIKNIEKYPDNVLIIKNRQGKRVYEKRSYTGEFCGENCPMGTYFYVLNIRQGKKTKQIVGSLEIIR
ncbi:MAG: gliding motility-associated C-terminal domain-containing protein [Bacteroidales bacterium]|nr:gliding motility-associated C-terminal domain-containing protein [Bacteroidales bacterium]